MQSLINGERDLAVDFRMVNPGMRPLLSNTQHPTASQQHDKKSMGACVGTQPPIPGNMRATTRDLSAGHCR